jgi:hypothetical protein
MFGLVLVLVIGLVISCGILCNFWSILVIFLFIPAKQEYPPKLWNLSILVLVDFMQMLAVFVSC